MDQTANHDEVKQFPFRLAAIDLDGTLLGPDKNIGPENSAAVQRLRDNGVTVIIASGRRHQNSVRFQRQLGLRGQHCLPRRLNSGWRKRQRGGSAFPSANRNAPDYQRRESNDIQPIYYHLDHLYVPEHNNQWIDLYEARVGERAEILPDLQQLDGRRALKIVWYGDPESLAKVRPEMSVRYSEKADVFSTERENLEFMPRGINKATALAKVAAEYGVLREKVLAFGDGENDVAMLEWAGTGVAMAHGNHSAIKAAKRVSPPGPPESAFARAVDALLEDQQ